MSSSFSLVARAFALLALAACATDADDADLGAAEDAVRGNASAIEIGFNGPADQFAYFDAFYAAAKAPPRERLCHVYVSWKVAEDETRPELEAYLGQAKDHCDEVMITFKSLVPAPVPDTPTVRAQYEKFLAVPWRELTGYAGTFSFTAWNEPNNRDTAGNGLGVQIPPDIAARYYLALEELCATRACKVAAGDFASNGNMWDDHLVAAGSYFDRYRRAIESAGVTPKYFAFHGWHDINRYLNEADHCSTYETCLTRRVLRGMKGAWQNVELWDNEVGVGQFSTAAPDDALQACGAAFLVRLTALDARITRMYLTRLKRGPGTLFRGPNDPRPGMGILARRDTQAAGFSCR